MDRSCPKNSELLETTDPRRGVERGDVDEEQQRREQARGDAGAGEADGAAGRPATRRCSARPPWRGAGRFSRVRWGVAIAMTP